MTTEPIEISAIVPVGEQFDTTGALVREYLEILAGTGKSFELVYVLDSEQTTIREQLLELAASERRLKIIRLAKSFGETTALSAGVEHTDGEIVLTLPAYYQVQPEEIPKLISELDSCDMAVGVRASRSTRTRFETIRGNIFNGLVRSVTGTSFSDLSCGARAFRRNVIEEVPIYGDQHRFIPILAARRGFSIQEVQLQPSANRGTNSGRYGPAIYLRRLLDIFAIVFLVRFTKKPLRFFGMIGSVTFLLGGIFLTYVVIERLFFGVGLADRPALLLSSLLVVLGLQIFAMGLLGELIIFTHARDLKEYTIEKIVN